MILRPPPPPSAILGFSDIVEGELGSLFWVFATIGTLGEFGTFGTLGIGTFGTLGIGTLGILGIFETDGIEGILDTTFCCTGWTLILWAI